YLAALTVGLITATAFIACGGSSDDDTKKKTDSGTGGGGGPDPEQPGRQPPAQSGGNPASGTTETVIAIRKLFLGETDPATGTADNTAWKKIGYNLDGIVSTKNGTNHCKVQAGGSKSAIQTDGDNGIDNSFGSNLVPIISTLASDPSKTISESLNDGSFTIMIRMKNL